MSIDKRIGKRHKRRFQLRYGVDEPSRLAFTEDISDTGFFIMSPMVVQPGTILFVELMLNDGATILIKGRIMWAKKVPQNLMRKVKGGMGVRILSFASGEDAYRQLCASLMR